MASDASWWFTNERFLYNFPNEFSLDKSKNIVTPSLGLCEIASLTVQLEFRAKSLPMCLLCSRTCVKNEVLGGLILGFDFDRRFSLPDFVVRRSSFFMFLSFLAAGRAKSVSFRNC